MKAAIFSAHEFDREALTKANKNLAHHLTFLKARLDQTTAALGRGYPAVIVFVNDCLDAVTLEALKNGGTRLVALRCAGFNNVDLDAAKRLGLHVVHVPTYSPHCVAEHVFALLLALMRHIPQAHNRVRDHNFSVEGLIGFELHGRTFAIVGTGLIGQAVARIANGFGCKLVGFAIARRYWAADHLYSAQGVGGAGRRHFTTRAADVSNLPSVQREFVGSDKAQHHFDQHKPRRPD
jgi:D-lactate dehydrogenase